MPVAMVARRTVAAMPAVAGSVMAVMAVDGVAAKCAYATTDEGPGQRVAVEGGGEASTSHSANSRGGKDAMFTRAAGREAEAEQADEAERDEAAHRALLGGPGLALRLSVRGAGFMLTEWLPFLSGGRAGNGPSRRSRGGGVPRKDSVPGCLLISGILLPFICVTLLRIS